MKRENIEGGKDRHSPERKTDTPQESRWPEKGRPHSKAGEQVTTNDHSPVPHPVPTGPPTPPPPPTTGQRPTLTDRHCADPWTTFLNSRVLDKRRSVRHKPAHSPDPTRPNLILSRTKTERRGDVCKFLRGGKLSKQTTWRPR